LEGGEDNLFSRFSWDLPSLKEHFVEEEELTQLSGWSGARGLAPLDTGKGISYLSFAVAGDVGWVEARQTLREKLSISPGKRWSTDIFSMDHSY
jgi:hypothetical protein